MDPSIRLDLIFGELAVSAEELTVAEWEAIIERVLGLSKPRLKYLPGFKPIQEEMIKSLGSGGYDRRFTPKNAIQEDCDNFGTKSRCLFIKDLRSELSGDLGGGHGFSRIRRQTLLLAQDGRLILWEQDYRVEIESGQGFRAHHTARYEIAELSRFTEAEQPLLRTMLEHDKKIGFEIIETLYLAVHSGVDDRIARLNEMKQLLDQLTGIRDKIDR